MLRNYSKALDGNKSLRTMPKNKINNTAEAKFKESQLKLQKAVERFGNEGESSDEDDLESADVIDLTLKRYNLTSDNNEGFISKTKLFLEETFQSGAITCLICISSIKRNESNWNCSECYCMFHLMCIQRWSKDTIMQRKNALEDRIQVKKMIINWCCPKCRHEYQPDNIPHDYFCFCKKLKNPVFQPLIIPHSCGETCGKPLKPECGHRCLLLCHPGPCPACPQTVTVSCHCGTSPARPQRCCNKYWSCSQKCNKLLACGKHKCTDMCHPGDCKSCTKKSLQKCLCGAEIVMRDCSSPQWQCSKVCDKPLGCGYHKCLEICHPGECVQCDSNQSRSCPCGKTFTKALCYVDIPCCEKICDKLLECGIHRCVQVCHKGNCQTCFETIEKTCRCGQYTKDYQCIKEFLCETKCKRMRDCNKHPCNKKCCNGNCTPCEKVCGRTLRCKKHACSSVCHQGPCYPCNLSEKVTCRCGAASIIVPCGKKNRTKPPKCSKLCLIPSGCIHKERIAHRCHYGDCPPCKQICEKRYKDCTHSCRMTCHIKLIKSEKGKRKIFIEEDNPCPPCTVPLLVTCFGGHETKDWPCHSAKPSSCFRECGQQLDCGNHKCMQACHTITGANCDECESGCDKARPAGCQHACPRPCHPDACADCTLMYKMKCHCGLSYVYIECWKWTSSDNQDALKCCKNQCPRNFPCGHRCNSTCHIGECPNADKCAKKVKVTCPCKRIKREITCELMQRDKVSVECDEVCRERQLVEKQEKDELARRQKIEEDERNRIELEKYEKMFTKKSRKQRKQYDVVEQENVVKKYLLYASPLIVIAIGIIYCYLF